MEKDKKLKPLLENYSITNDEVIDKNIIKDMNSQEKQELLGLLEKLIVQSYKIEKDFKDSKALYEWVIELLPQAIWVINDNGSFFYKNTFADKLMEIFQEAKKQNFNGEAEFKDKTYLFQSNSIQNKQVITATDITLQKRQERLASMGQVSAHLAHEIRNPIGSISLLTSTLLKRVSQETKPIVFEIQKSLWRVERIIRATLLFSKGVNLNKEIHHFSELKNDIEDAIEQYTYSKNIDFNFEFEDNQGAFDLDLMGIVLQNFVYNAIDAIEESEYETGKIIIKTKVESDFIIFNIQDNGKEIENKEMLFEPFKTTKLKGNGLGLALSLQIVEAHNGTIELLNTPQKTFEIKIKNFLEN